MYRVNPSACHCRLSDKFLFTPFRCDVVFAHEHIKNASLSSY